KDYLLKPFRDAKQLIDENDNIKEKDKRWAKVVAAVVTGFFYFFGVIGLGMACFTGFVQLAAFTKDVLHMGKYASAAVGIAFGAVCSFMGRVIFTLERSAFAAKAYVFRKYAKNRETQTTDDKKAAFAAADVVSTAIFYFTQSESISSNNGVDYGVR